MRIIFYLQIFITEVCHKPQKKENVTSIHNVVSQQWRRVAVSILTDAVRLYRSI